MTKTWTPIKKTAFRSKCLCFAASIMAVGCGTSSLAQPTEPLPHIATHAGHHALVVDNAPFLILGAQANNSSNWPAQLPMVWPAIEALGANTLEIPVSWEQVEPVEGQFDFSYVDTLLDQARAHHVRLVLLWFGTWKNNSPSYTPEWVKADNGRFPRVVDKAGDRKPSLSPVFAETVKADSKAFATLMRHIKATDPQHTVIMMQVENETGTYGSVRDYSPAANTLFDGPVPKELIIARHLKPGSWTEVFGKDADEFFHAWYVSRFVDQVAAAGKTELDLPMYVNAALRDPVKYQDPVTYSSGGPTWNVLDIWKAGAPHIDIIGPDIYMPDTSSYMATLNSYDRTDNPLLVPETGRGFDYGRYLFSVLGRGGIGFSPFGMDYTRDANEPAMIPPDAATKLEPFSDNYHMIAPMARQWAQLAFDGQVWGVSEPDDREAQTLDLGRWTATVTYGMPAFGNASYPPNFKPIPRNPRGAEGGMVVARLGPDEFLVAGRMARIAFSPKPLTGKHMQFVRVEEGSFVDGKWVLHHVWNGDQTDWGLNLSTVPRILKVTLGTY